MSMHAHPSFEDLSAYHDGEAPEWAAHVAACAECRSQLDRLAALTAHVAGPVPAGVSPTGVDPVARALAAAGAGTDADPVAVGAGGRSGQGAGQAPGDRAGAAAAAPLPLPERPVPQAIPVGASDRSRWMGWITAASAAAVVLLVAGVFALVARGGGGGTTTALTDPSDRESSARAPGVAGPGPDRPGADIDEAVLGGDLGEIPDAATLVARAGPGLRTGRERAAASTPTAPPVPAGGGDGIAPPAAGVVGTRPCEMEARDRGGNLGPVVYYATAVRAGVPAVVLGFATGGGSGPVTVQLLAQGDCRLLLAASVP